jgi:hypothetical protein
MKFIAFLVSILLLVACATPAQVTQLGPNTYQATPGDAAFGSASQTIGDKPTLVCAEFGKKPLVQTISPNGDVVFSCLDEDNPEYIDADHMPMPGYVWENPTGQVAVEQNFFLAITPEPVSEGLEGPWTGNIGPFLVTMKLQSDGYGLFCYSYGTADVLQKAKFSEGAIQIEDGTKLILKEQKPESITVYATTVYTTYGTDKDTMLYTDSDYENASGYCAKALNK